MINDFEVPKSGYEFDSNGKERTFEFKSYQRNLT